jgi:hypothetical protein
MGVVLPALGEYQRVVPALRIGELDSVSDPEWAARPRCRHVLAFSLSWPPLDGHWGQIMTHPRRRLISSLVVVGVLVVGGGVGLYFLLRDSGADPGSAPPDDPRAVSARFAAVIGQAYTTKDENAVLAELEQIVCGRDFAAVRQETLERRSLLRAGGQPGATIESTATDVQVNGDRGMFTLTLRFGAGREPVKHPFALVREDGGWRVCELYEREPQPPSR